ncbi:MAG TPA: caspase family protein, partial [Gemmata sp.]|nr:caspase family protein [Gemmata sp.]
AQKYDKVLLQTTSVADIVPPETTIDVGLAEDQIVDQDSFTVKASAKGTGKQLITAMRLIVDGRPFQGTKGIKRFDVPLETAETSWDVPLTPGPHTFAVIAETAVSKGMTKTVTITRKGEVPKPNLYVLAMGVSAYPGDMKLRYAASDATLLANAFKSQCKGVFANIEVNILTDKKASKKGIQEGLDWLASKMTAKDVGIVSFSGHGTRDPEGKFYLVPVDINPRDPFHTCFAGDEFKSRLDNMPGRLVAILDACHSGEVAEHAQPPVSSDSLAQDLASEDSGVVVMSASLGREYAIESQASKAGFFTLGLVEGLGGLADVNEDGVIYINELDMYAYARVHQLSHGQQHSTTSLPPGIRPFPLATVTKAP